MDLAAQRPRWPINEPEEFRVELQHWISENWDLEVTVAEWWDRLARAGLTAPTWPRSQGGLAATTGIQAVVEEELAKIGAILAPLTVPWIAITYGWQEAFIITGALGFVWLIFWWLGTSKSPRPTPPRTGQSR